MEIKFEKVVAGKYEILLDAKLVGFAEKLGSAWVVNGLNGERSGCFGKSRKEAVEMYVAILTDVPEEDDETELEKFIKSFDTHYATFEKYKLAGTPELDYNQWFLARYGLTEVEAGYKVRKLNKPEYEDYNDMLYAWYVEYIGCVDAEEAEGYNQNDIDTWNDYLRDWKEVNPSLPEVAVAVAEDDDADLVFPEGKKPRTIQLNDYKGHAVAVRECVEYEDILEVLVDGKNVVDLFRFIKEGEGCFEWSCYDGTNDFGTFPSPKRAIKAFLESYLEGVS